jgi:glycosyltransferase involved in cell wall biosynthesis
MTFASVITPAYRAEKTIAIPVGSILAQTHENWEMIIVSDDGLDYRSILSSHGIEDSRLRFASTGKTAAGPGAARNIGTENARYTLLFHLDADDRYAEDYLARIVPVLETAGACVGAVRLIDPISGDEIPLSVRPAADCLMTVREAVRYCLGYATVAINSRIVSARWPEGLHYGEDFLFWLLLLEEIPGIAYVSAARYDYYFRMGSLSRPNEPTTYGICERRERMIEWLESRPFSNPAIPNVRTWLHSINDMEAEFGYRIVDTATFSREAGRRFDAAFGG